MRPLKLFLLTFLLWPAAAFAHDALTNADIVELVRAGLGDQIIIRKISESNARFDVSVKALVELKKAGVAPA